jgi:hypothetical protein
MTKRSVALLAAFSLWLLPQAAAAAPTDPSGERVWGKALQGGFAKVSLSAHGDPESGAGSGQITNVWPQGVAYRVRVTCVTVVGNQATVGGEITASEVFPGLVGSGLSVTVADNAGTGEPDGLAHSLNSEPQPLPGASCPNPGNTFPIDRGNIRVSAGTA